MAFLWIGAIAQQTTEFAIQDFKPVSPTAYQFLKYTELPVSEYTGTANISVPIYDIKEDGVTIPLALSYHSGGYRVSEEASWVGLGWDLSVGSIVQQVNNMDDYAGETLLQPDYQNSPIPTDLPYRYAWGTGCPTCNGASWSNPYPIFSGATSSYGYSVATDYYLPINGNFDNQSEGQYICQQSPSNPGAPPVVDSDPDVFTASFLGHMIKFILNFKTGQIVVLNKQGYTVTRAGDNYEIVVPSGEQYYFALNTKTTYSSVTIGGMGGNPNAVGSGESSRIWLLTKIITKHKRQILLNYTQTDTVEDYPSYSERWDTAFIQGSPVAMGCTGGGTVGSYFSLATTALNGIARSYSSSTENRVFLSSITYPNGQVNFYTSSRSDLLGGQKLDSVSISSTKHINTYRLAYGYMNSSTVTGTTYTPSNAGMFGNMPNFRLQLLSVSDNTGAVYAFTYNPTLLPPKNSLAQDFWGFYNGQLNNFSLIPNPVNLLISGLGNNGNNNSASAYYSQAGMLTKIQYPTGGTDSIEYELNKFSNYWVPDSGSTTNVVSTGNGLRVHAIDYRAQGTRNARRTVFSYMNGVDIVPLHIYSNYSVPQALSGGTIYLSEYTVNELRAKGFFSSNPLASLSGVGYGEVIEKDVAPDGTNNGQTINFYADTADNVSNSGVTASEVMVALPATKVASTPENGSPLMSLTYDNQGNLLKRTVYSYTNILSNYYYGARIFGYGTYSVLGNGSCSSWSNFPQNLMAFYPIFDFESLRTGTVTTEYSGPDSLVTTEGVTYDSYNQPYVIIRYTPAYYQSQTLEYPYTNNFYHDAASQRYLMGDHRLSDVVYQQTYQGRYPFQNGLADSAIKHYAQGPNGAVVEQSMSAYKNLMVANPMPDSVNYDLYDSTYANLLQLTHNYSTQSLLWNYNGELVSAQVTNATQANIAATSFESTGNGNWQYSGASTADTTSPTGSYCYNLGQSGGTITSRSLSTSTAYVLSYWIKGSTPLSITGTQPGYPIQGKTIKGWTYFEHKVAGQSTITVSGTGFIDELRLYPTTAQMTTYTYWPMVGITTQCDVDNRVTYYDYDAYGRLKDLRDQDGNIIKTYNYHYKGH